MVGRFLDPQIEEAAEHERRIAASHLRRVVCRARIDLGLPQREYTLREDADHLIVIFREKALA